MIKLTTIKILGLPYGILQLEKWYDKTQGRSQNLKEVLQIFLKVFKFDDVRNNDVVEKNQYR